MLYRINHTTKYAYTEPVAICHNLVRLAPLSCEGQTRRSYRLIVTPEPAELVQRIDSFGNQVDYFAIQEAHWGLSLCATSELTVEERQAPPASSAPWESVRDRLRAASDMVMIETYQFAFPSTFVPCDRLLAEYASMSFTPGRPIVEALVDLTARIHTDFEYDPRATNVTTPVYETFEKRAGVCQDFAHIEIACLRSIGLAARYVSGYLRTIPPPGKKRLIGADASHAWLALYCGDPEHGHAGWIDVDPTNNIFSATDHVTIALGRDYADVCPVQGVYVGGGTHTLHVSVDVEPLD